jgi:hypothetical protein
MLYYVSKILERLKAACASAPKSLSLFQKRMKIHYDKEPVGHSCTRGTHLVFLVLLPIPGSPLLAHLSGPYLVEKKLCDTNYVIKTPDGRRSSRVCHFTGKTQ